MKRKYVPVLFLLLTTVFMLSCVTSHDVHYEISCEEFETNPKSMVSVEEIEIGDKIFITLCSNPSTGFKWGYEMSGEDAVKEEGYDYEEPKDDVVGAAGKDIWTFEGANKGTTEIFMSYSQPWEGGTKNEWTYKITVTVK